MGTCCTKPIHKPVSSEDIVRNGSNNDGNESPEPPVKQNYGRRKSVSAEAYNPDDDSDDDTGTKVIHPKSDQQRVRLTEATQNVLAFRELDQEQMQDVLDAMFERVVTPGDEVITQGDDGDNFYVIESGHYDISVLVDGVPKVVGSYDGKGSFGELALMYNQPRAATIVATTPGALWAMDRATFRQIVLKTAYNKRRNHEALLAGCSLLVSLESEERANVADALVTQRFEDGAEIIKQGDEADCMYFVEEGEAVVRIKAEEDGQQVELTRCTAGGYFGELALVTKQLRAASVYASGPIKCAVLDVKAFERLLGPAMDIMKRNIGEYEQQLRQLGLAPSNTGLAAAATQ